MTSDALTPVLYRAMIAALLALGLVVSAAAQETASEAAAPAALATPGADASGANASDRVLRPNGTDARPESPTHHAVDS